MTDKFEQKEPSDKIKNNQPLDGAQKALFTIFCWGVIPWSLAANFKTIGYDQKYIDARKALHTGLTIYGLGILLFMFILWLL